MYINFMIMATFMVALVYMIYERLTFGVATGILIFFTLGLMPFAMIAFSETLKKVTKR